MIKKILAGFVATFFATAAFGQNAGTVTNHAFPIGKGPGVTGYTSLLCGSAQLAVGQAAADPICRTVSGDWTLSAAGVATLATVNGNVGTFGSATSCVTVTSNAKGLTTAISAATCTPAIGSITGLGAGVATWLATPSSANLRAALTDETGTGLAYFQGGDIGTPSAGVATNITALNATQLTTGAVPAARMPALTGDCTTSAGAVAVTCTQAAADFNVIGILRTGGDVRVTAQFDKTSSAVLANVPGLSVTLAAGLTYGFDVKLYTVSNGASGVQAAIGGTVTATAFTFTESCLDPAGLVCYGRSTTLGATPTGSTAATVATIQMTGTITVNAGGTLTAMFAQNVSGGVASSVLVGSTMRVWKIL